MMLETDTNANKEAIAAVLDELPPESLAVLRQFAAFLHQQAQAGLPVTAAAKSGTPYLYPNVASPTSNLQALAHMLAEGYVGNALEDTEALYDGD